MTSSTWSGVIPALFIASLMASAPKSTAGICPNFPKKEPTGVRTALTITTSLIISHLLPKIFKLSKTPN